MIAAPFHPASHRLTRWGIAYLLLLPPVVLGAALASTAVLEPLRRASGAVIWAANVLPGFTVGAISYTLLARWLVRAGALRPTLGGHIGRALSLYACVGLGAFWLARGWHTPDFGLWAQLVLWPVVAALGGLTADAIITWKARHAAGAAG
jgi:hypothetical protein